MRKSGSTVVWTVAMMAILLLATQICLADSLNVHWCPDVRPGQSGIQHAGTLSGNIWFNFVKPMDNDPNTMESLSYVSGYVQEITGDHPTPQIALPYNGLNTAATCPLCAGSNQMVLSTDPSLIFQLMHNKSYTVSMTVKYTKMTMFPLGSTSTNLTLTTTVSANNVNLTQWPDYVVAWDPGTMAGVNLSCQWDDAQRNLASVTYTVGGLANMVSNIDSPGTNTYTWNGMNGQFQMPKGLYSTQVNVTTGIPTMGGDCNRSSYLTIVSATDAGGNSIAMIQHTGYNGESPKYTVSYKLKDTGGFNATSGAIDMYNANLQLVGTVATLS